MVSAATLLILLAEKIFFEFMRVQPHPVGVLGQFWSVRYVCPYVLSQFSLQLVVTFKFAIWTTGWFFKIAPSLIATSTGAVVRGGNFNSSPCTLSYLVWYSRKGTAGWSCNWNPLNWRVLHEWCRTRRVWKSMQLLVSLKTVFRCSCRTRQLCKSMQLKVLLLRCSGTFLKMYYNSLKGDL